MKNACDVFAEKCVDGITANEKRCAELVELSMAMVTSLAPKIGYDRAAEIAKESARTGKTVRELCREKKILPEGELNDALDPVEDDGAGRHRFRRRLGRVRACLTMYGGKRQRPAIFRRRKYRDQVSRSHL